MIRQGNRLAPPTPAGLFPRYRVHQPQLEGSVLHSGVFHFTGTTPTYTVPDTPFIIGISLQPGEHACTSVGVPAIGTAAASQVKETCRAVMPNIRPTLSIKVIREVHGNLLPYTSAALMAVMRVSVTLVLDSSATNP